MYNSERSHYIFKQSSGQVWSFYHDLSLGLCYSILNKRGSWSEGVIIQKSSDTYFSVDIDAEDKFHIFFQDKQGNLFYQDLSSNRVVPVLSSKAPFVYNKYLGLVAGKNWCQLFYILPHNNSFILANQTISGGVVSAPSVIDYVTKCQSPYSIIKEKTGNLYLFYQSSDGKYLQLGYKKFNQSQKVWSEFTSITKAEGDSENPKALTDSSNIIHICYQRKYENSYKLMYQQKIPDKNIWTYEHILHSSNYSMDNASLIMVNKVLIAYWVKDETIYFCNSEDGGNTWSKASKSSFYYGKQLMKLSFKSNDPYESEKVLTNEIPGCFINGYKLAFYQSSGNNDISSLTASELRNMIVESLSLVKNNIEDLKETSNAMKENISELEIAQKNFEKEMTKYALKLNLLENEFRQLKHVKPKADVLGRDFSRTVSNNFTKATSNESKDEKKDEDTLHPEV